MNMLVRLEEEIKVAKDTNILKYTTKMQNIFNYICLQTKNE